MLVGSATLFASSRVATSSPNLACFIRSAVAISVSWSRPNSSSFHLAFRTRDRRKRSSLLQGSSHHPTPAEIRNFRRLSRETSSSGRTQTTPRSCSTGYIDARPSTPRSPSKPHQEGLGLVVSGVAKQDRTESMPARPRADQPPPGIAGGTLEVPRRGDGFPVQRFVLDAQFTAERGNEPCLRVGPITESVVDRCAPECATPVLQPRVGKEQERNGITAAGNRDTKFRAFNSCLVESERKRRANGIVIHLFSCNQIGLVPVRPCPRLRDRSERERRLPTTSGTLRHHGQVPQGLFPVPGWRRTPSDPWGNC